MGSADAATSKETRGEGKAQQYHKVTGCKDRRHLARTAKLIEAFSLCFSLKAGIPNVGSRDLTRGEVLVQTGARCVKNWLIEADFGTNMALQRHLCRRFGPFLLLVSGSNVTFGIPCL